MGNRTFVLTIALITALLTMACGDEAPPGVATTQASSTTIGEAVPASVSEQDIATARQAFDAHKARWDNREPVAYTMAIGVETVSELRISFDETGSVVAEEIVRGDPSGSDTDSLPRSVTEVFTIIDELILGFEDGTMTVPEAGECGHHLNVRFDPEWGVPSRYDTLGPCDDGVGVVIDIIRD